MHLDGMKMIAKGIIFRNETACMDGRIHTHSFTHVCSHPFLGPQEKSSEKQRVTGGRQKEGEPRQTAQYYLIGKTVVLD